MTAERELDAQIAVKVLDLPPELIHNGPGPRTVMFGGRMTEVAENDHYSTDISAADDVIDRLREADIEVVIGCFKEGFSVELRQWRDRRADGITGDPHTGRSRVTFCLLTGQPTLPMAVCRAAVRPETIAALKESSHA